MKAQNILCSANQNALPLPISTNHITQDRKFPIFQKITGKMCSEPALIMGKGQFIQLQKRMRQGVMGAWDIQTGPFTVL